MIEIQRFIFIQFYDNFMQISAKKNRKKNFNEYKMFNFPFLKTMKNKLSHFPVLIQNLDREV